MKVRGTMYPMSFIRKHIVATVLVIGIFLTMLFILGETSWRTTIADTIATLPQATQRAAVSDFNSSLVAHYTFDDGTATDASGKGNNGTVNGAVQTTGKVGGGALKFDGIDDSVSGAQLFSTAPGAFTVSGWGNWTTVEGNSRVLAGKYDGSSKGFFVGSYNPGSPQCKIDTTSVRGSVSTMVPNQWYFLACTWDGSTLSLYVNGSLISSAPVSTITMPIHTFMVGRYINNSYFPGMIDDVRVYDKALSSEEIGYLYALGGATPPPATPPVTPPGGETTPTQPTTPPADTQAPAVPGGLIPVAPPPTTPVITGPVVKAASCSQADVQTAIDAAKDGDVVEIPVGVCTWTTTLTINKAITLKGSGIDQTTLVNGVSHEKIASCNCTAAQIIKMNSNALGLVRLTNMTIDGGAGTVDTQNNGSVKVSGSSKNWRIDHMRFRITRNSAIHVWAPGGVIDHNRFDIIGWYMAIYGFNGGGSFGDQAWAEPTNLGTDNALYIEDNIFYSATPSLGLDGWVGQRVVVRFNSFTNSRVGNHGTESSQRQRGARSYEIYNNTFNKTNSDAYSDGIGVRSGVGVIFNNTLTGSFTMVGSMHNYRDPHPYSPWGQCDGTSPFDLNDVEADGVTTKVYDTGSATANALVVNQSITLTTTGKSWATNQWEGYSIWNKNTGVKSPIFSNTTNTIVSYTDTTNGGKALAWTTGDQFAIVRASACLDQVGRGKGNLISNYAPTPQSWPRQEPDPTYVWNNMLKGTVKNIGDSSVHIVENRDYFNNMCKPGYTPYTYPHPLVQSQDGVSSQAVPLNCPGSPTPISGVCSSSFNMCTSGIFADEADTSTQSKWSCVGSNGGSTVSCSLPKPDITTKPGDFNSDGAVNTLDFSLMVAVWNQSSPIHDLNKDGMVNSLDFSILVQHWTR